MIGYRIPILVGVMLLLCGAVFAQPMSTMLYITASKGGDDIEIAARGTALRHTCKAWLHNITGELQGRGFKIDVNRCE